MASDVLFLEDLVVGQAFGSGTKRFDENEIVEFARRFDPQPFHLGREGAKDSFFGGLAASGWHTASVTMLLLVESPFRPAGGIVGTGFDEFQWKRPVYPGDTLRLESEVLQITPSKSKPNQGLIKLKMTTLNQNSEPVQVLIANLIAQRRPAS
jgi:acyl dehydratase